VFEETLRKGLSKFKLAPNLVMALAN